MIIALILGTGFLGNSSPAHAAGESYVWKDSGQSAIEASNGAYTAPFELTKSATDASGISFTGQAQISCGISKSNATVTLHIAAKDYQKTTPTPVDNSSYNQLITDCKTTTIDSSTTIAAAPAADKTDSPGSCQGTFAWIACPFINDISKFISDTAVKIITPFLHVNTISAAHTPGLYSAWQGIKNFAEVLFIIIFLIIIFSTTIGTGLDQYSIKRMLPRVVAGAILVQFSFFISAFIIDLGNILGAGVADLITVATAGTPNTDPTFGGFLTNIPTVIAPLVAGTAIWASLPLVLPTLGIMLLSVIAILFTFAARYILIAILVVLSPLALVAWILPNTEHYFKQWYKSFIRLILMYPIIIGLFTLGGRLGDILGSSNEVATNGAAGLFIDILKPFIVVIIFLAIPFAFKWAGGLMHAAHQTMSVINKGASKSIRESDSHKRRRDETEGRRIDRMRRFSERSKIQGLTNTDSKGIFGMTKRTAGAGLLSARALSVGGGPASKKALEQRYSRLFRSSDKELDELNDIHPRMFNEALTAFYGDEADRPAARNKVLTDAPILMDYMKTSSGRAAILSRSNAKSSFSGNNLREIANANPAELERMMRTAAKNNFKERGNLFANDFKTITGPGQGNQLLASELFTTQVKRWKAKTISDDIDGSVFADATGAEVKRAKDATGKSIGPIFYTSDARSDSFATIIANEASSLAFAGAFDPRSRTPMDKAKKVQILALLANKRHIFAASDAGVKLRNTILDEVAKAGNAEIYDEFLIEYMGQTDYIVRGMPTADKLAEIERLLK